MLSEHYALLETIEMIEDVHFSLGPGASCSGTVKRQRYRVSIYLFGAYKTGKHFNISFEGSPAAMKAHEQDIIAWLAGFKIVQ